jgi:hypothetical protein
MPIEYGSKLYKGNRPISDASIVEIVRRAGALIVGTFIDFVMDVVLSCCRQDNYYRIHSFGFGPRYHQSPRPKPNTRRVVGWICSRGG